MNSPSPAFADVSSAAARSRAARIWFSAPVRIVIGVLAVGLSAALTFPAIKFLLPSPAARFVWPFLMAMLLVLLVYAGFVKLMERRVPTELSLRGAGGQVAAGLAIGAAAVAVAVGLLAGCGSYRITAYTAWSAALAAPLAEMLFIGVFEEVLFRAVLFRIVERALGSWPALLLTAALFALAHLGGSISTLGLINTALASLMLSAAWMLSRSLWLCAAIHAAWNYTLGSIFSIAVSGHPAKGWMVGTVAGPDWLSGGAYGLEASVCTTLVMAALFVTMYLLARRRGRLRARPVRNN